MKFATVILSVSAFAFAANGPAYNPSTAVAVEGTVTSVRTIPAGQPLAGVHLNVKTKTNTLDVYLAPKDFMNFLKADFAPGDVIDVTGSQVKSGSANVILAREVADDTESIELRDLNGAPVWENWGVEVDTATIH